MDSPIRKQQKRNDYLRHKMFRKIKRRRKAEQEQAINAPAKELRRRLRRKTFKCGKDAYEEGKDNIKGYARELNGHNVAFDDSGNLVDQVTGETGTLMLPEITVRPGVEVRNAVERKLRAQASRSEMYGYIDPISGEYYPHGSGALIGVSPEFDIILGAPLIKAAGKMAGEAVWNSTAGQYLRYPIGKLKYGFDAKLPTLYRKIKGGVVPTPQNGRIMLTNPHPRFGYADTGEVSPEITNFTYDTSVRSHSRGDWDSGFTIAVPGKTLLGKNVVSTEPSDVFTFGSKIQSKLKDATILSGDAQELATAKQLGYKTTTNENVQSAYNAAKEGAATNGNQKFVLAKEDYSNYARALRQLERETFGSPRQKDVDFMNYVFKPQIEGKVYGRDMLNYAIANDERIASQFGNAQMRRYFLNDQEWGNILYDPSSPVEGNWRKTMNIDLLKKIPLALRQQQQTPVYDTDRLMSTYSGGKDSGIHIKPENRGKFTRLKKRTGKSASWFKAHGTPAQKKMATFALNARKWKHK